MRILFIVIGLMLSTNYVQAEEESKVYKTTDEFGRPVFSDQGGEQAEEVEVKEPATFPAGRYAEDYRRVTAESGTQSQEEGDVYSKLAILYPENNATVRSNPGDFEVKFQVVPRPQAGHTLQLLMDGAVYKEINATGSLQLTNVNRGTHKLQLQVVTDAGKVIQQGPAVTMHLLRHSVLHPQGRKSQN